MARKRDPAMDKVWAILSRPRPYHRWLPAERAGICTKRCSECGMWWEERYPSSCGELQMQQWLAAHPGKTEVDYKLRNFAVE